jgi:hypothetical protein
MRRGFVTFSMSLSVLAYRSMPGGDRKPTDIFGGSSMAVPMISPSMIYLTTTRFLIFAS